MNRKYGIAEFLVLLAAFGFFAIPSMNYGVIGGSESYVGPVSTDNGPYFRVTWNGLACATITRKSGAVEDLGCKHNLIVNGAKDMAIGDLFGLTAQGTNNIWDQIAIGQNVTPFSAADTALSGIYTNCGLEIATAVLTRVAVGNVSSVYTWTSTCDSKTITAVAMYNHSNSVLATEAVVSSATLNTGDKLTVTYYGAQT